MNREQVGQIARKHHLQVFDDKHASIAKWVIDAIMEAVAVEREECANIVADAAPGFCGGRAEIVLYSVAETIRARGNE